MSSCSFRAWEIHPSTSEAASRDTLRTSFCHAISREQQQSQFRILWRLLVPYRLSLAARGVRWTAQLQMPRPHSAEITHVRQIGGLRRLAVCAIRLRPSRWVRLSSYRGKWKCRAVSFSVHSAYEHSMLAGDDGRPCSSCGASIHVEGQNDAGRLPRQYSNSCISPIL